MFFKQFYDQYLSQMSYLVGCQRTGEAIIIDPIRNVTPYIEVAEQEGLRITHVTETHIHADFASGLRDVSHQLGAHMFISGEGDQALSYNHLPGPATRVKDGDIIKVGNVELQVWHTPGHTPESISFVLTDVGGGADVPMGIFTGDFLFVGSIGRPDLLEKSVQIAGSTEIGAKQMFQSIQRVKALPNHLQIWPGHGAGSPCGKSLGAVPMSTLGYEKQTNWALQERDEQSFIEELTADQPAPPHHFANMKELNQNGHRLFQPYQVYPLQVDDRKELMFDIRSRTAYHGGHLRGSINIPFDKNFINQIGWYLDYDQPAVLIGESWQVQEAAHVLQLIGFDQVKGYLPPKDEVITQHVHSRDITGDEGNVLDVRNETEWADGHLPQAHHLPHGQLLNQPVPFDKQEPIYVHCQSGVRSSIAVGLLERKGFEHIVHVKEGYQGI
ncbi:MULTISPECIES: persulfide dioxygenase-sulfurtransferase CstB [Gracilibacillus]|uniref:persulfide dioxygenase-sulfurtransferase CstB n=1 Tax=Gracilibacillus TaxID=74385 RepID=UPI00082419E4|nr:MULTISPECIES: persulfide dioxygenase-sulfurtransferase CstB [Gracilibacillus]